MKRKELIWNIYYLLINSICRNKMISLNNLNENNEEINNNLTNCNIIYYCNEIKFRIIVINIVSTIEK